MSDEFKSVIRIRFFGYKRVAFKLLRICKTGNEHISAERSSDLGGPLCKMLTKYQALCTERRDGEWSLILRRMILLAGNKKKTPRKDRTRDDRDRFVAHGAPFTIPIGYPEIYAYTNCHCIRAP